jgi:hypothetical protein
LTGDPSTFQIAYRDGNPLNLLQSNLGLRSRASGKVWWLELLSGEVDPVHDTRGFANHVPAVIAARRAIIPGDRPLSVPWPKRINPKRQHLPPKPKSKWIAEIEAEEQRLRGSQTVASKTP